MVTTKMISQLKKDFNHPLGKNMIVMMILGVLTNVIGRIVSNQMIQSLGMIIFTSIFLVIAIETWKFSKKISSVMVLLWLVAAGGQAQITYFLR